MLLFCPHCSNVLTVSTVLSTSTQDQDEAGGNRLECRTCPYQYIIKVKFYDRQEQLKKEVDDVIGGKDAWIDANKTTVQCPNTECNGREAAFYSVQIRSADEPSTNFFRCMTCEKEWRDD